VKDNQSSNILDAASSIFEIACSEVFSETGGAVLVHCSQGISRSAAVIIYFLIACSVRRPGEILISEDSNMLYVAHATAGDGSSTLVPMEHFSLNAAFKYVKSRRRVILPNIGFMKQLQIAEVQLLNRTTVSFGDHGQIYWNTHDEL
jgi:hypothetical protein